MPYKGSYVWKIRQKVGHDALILPTSDAIAVRDDGKLMCIYNIDFQSWLFPGGYPELGQTSDECAAQELLEEAGIVAAPSSMVPIALVSGHESRYPNGDVVYPHTQVFITDSWKELCDELDTEEVTEKRWFSIEELEAMELALRMKRTIRAYQEYTRTGQYQMINMKDFK